MAKVIFKKDYKNLGQRNKAPLPNRGIYASNDINLPRFLHFVNVEWNSTTSTGKLEVHSNQIKTE